MTEEWRDIIGYEGYYQVSNLGNVKSLDRVVSTGHYHGMMMKQTVKRKGYKSVSLTKDGKGTVKPVHRLVAISFIPNHDNKPFVNHLDETPGNNNMNNLEWATVKENSNYGTRNERLAKSISKPIKVIYQDNTFEYWESGNVFANEYGINSSGISNVLSGSRKTYHGLRFEYA